MNVRSPSPSIQHVYRDRGQPVERRFEGAPPSRRLVEAPTPFVRLPVAQLMTRTLTCAHPSLAADVVAELLVRERVGCVPIVDKHGRPVGMITKGDLVEQLLVVGPVGTESPSTASLLPRTAMELMVPVLVTLAEDAIVAEAATVMARECLHHLGIVDADGRLIGVVSAMDLVRGLSASARRPSP
jgi:CBS domain-containing protein